MMLFVFMMPSGNLPRVSEIRILPILAHVCLFSGFTFLYILERMKHKSMNRPSVALYFSAVLYSILFGSVIEFLQEVSSFGRNAEFADVIYDTAGSLFTVQLLILFYRFRGNWPVKD
jgi:VanZ family protein